MEEIGSNILFSNSIDSLFLPKADNISTIEQSEIIQLNTSFEFPDLVELFPASDSNATGNSFLFENHQNTENVNFFGDINPISNEPWKLFENNSPATESTNSSLNKLEVSISNIKIEKKEIIDESKVRKQNLSEIKPNIEGLEEQEEKQDEPSSPARKRQKQNITPTKKAKKQLSPEELEEKKKMQLEKRLIKNRRTADISRKRKKAKKATFEESIKTLAVDNISLEKQSIELSAENRVLKTEYLALLSLIQNTPKLSKMFDTISTLAVTQPPEKLVMANTASAASVYLLNVIYSIHQTWNMLKTVNPEQKVNQPLPNIVVN